MNLSDKEIQKLLKSSETTVLEDQELSNDIMKSVHIIHDRKVRKSKYASLARRGLNISISLIGILMVSSIVVMARNTGGLVSTEATISMGMGVLVIGFILAEAFRISNTSNSHSK